MNHLYLPAQNSSNTYVQGQTRLSLRARPHAQVFVALLRLCQADNKKALVRDALDTLTPVLVRRLAPGDLKYPIWVRYTKKVLVEEGHSTPHLIHIWQLLVRHADLYYSSR